MSLVHHLDQVTGRIAALECHACHTRFVESEWVGLGSEELRCSECGAGGFIQRGTDRVRDRFPGRVGSQFTPMPVALMQHARTLGLGAHELLVIWVLESHRWTSGDWSKAALDTISDLTTLSPDQVKRATRRLVRAGFIERRRLKSGHTHYNLEPLWIRLATEQERPGAQMRPGSADTAASTHRAPVPPRREHERSEASEHHCAEQVEVDVKALDAVEEPFRHEPGSAEARGEIPTFPEWHRQHRHLDRGVAARAYRDLIEARG